jgi:signal transduction histidine kinase
MGMKERVNLLGGEITITSEANHGTNVLIELPA